MSKSAKEGEQTFESVSAESLCVSASQLHHACRVMLTVVESEGMCDDGFAESEKYWDEMVALVNDGGHGEKVAYARTIAMMRVVLGMIAGKIDTLSGEGTWETVREGLVEFEDKYHGEQDAKLRKIANRQGGRTHEQLH